MVDGATEGGTTNWRCPWCSAELATPTEAVCPSCGATLSGGEGVQLPGVTAIDAEAIIRGARGTTHRPRSRLMSLITGDSGGEPEVPPAAGSLDLPSIEVRREILRLQVEAELKDMSSEASSLLADDAVEAGDEGLAEQASALAADAAELGAAGVTTDTTPTIVEEPVAEETASEPVAEPGAEADADVVAAAEEEPDAESDRAAGT